MVRGGETAQRAGFVGERWAARGKIYPNQQKILCKHHFFVNMLNSCWLRYGVSMPGEDLHSYLSGEEYSRVTIVPPGEGA